MKSQLTWSGLPVSHKSNSMNEENIRFEMAGRDRPFREQVRDGDEDEGDWGPGCVLCEVINDLPFFRCTSCRRRVHKRCLLKNDTTIEVPLYYNCNSCRTTRNPRSLRGPGDVIKQRKVEVNSSAKDVITLLLELGADPLKLNDDLQLPLHCAVKSNNLKAIQKLLDSDDGKTMVLKKLSQGKSIIHAAAEYGSPKAIQMLLEKMAPINALDCVDQTPIFMGIKSGNLEGMKCLKSCGANLELKTRDKRSLLHRAVWEGNHEITEWLLKEGLSPDSKDGNDWTPLHSAAALGNIAIASLLLQYGADIKCPTTANECPVEIAQKYNRRGMVLFLRYHLARNV